MDYSDTELTALLATDMHRHFTQVMARYQHRLYSFALRLTGSPHDAEDIVQEAFIRAYVTLLNYATTRVQTLKLRPWLYTVTLNTFRERMRVPQLQLVSLDLSEESAILALEDTQQERPDVLFERQERFQELEQLVARLPERYRVAVTCYFFESFSYQEIAELLNQPIGTVKSTVFRGIRLLRAMLNTQLQEGGKEQIWNIRSASTSNNQQA